MNKTNRDKINLIFSSFLVIGYLVCAYFFTNLAAQVAGVAGLLIDVLVLVVFGLLLFYATRVGEGKQVRRFSLAVLLLVDVPALVVILAAMIEGFPFLHNIVVPAGSTGPSILLILACIALGYGIPYTFFSGYEIAAEEEAETAVDEVVFVEGGLAEELADSKNDDDSNFDVD